MGIMAVETGPVNHNSAVFDGCRAYLIFFISMAYVAKGRGRGFEHELPGCGMGIVALCTIL